jgi:hypothetical protein
VELVLAIHVLKESARIVLSALLENIRLLYAFGKAKRRRQKKRRLNMKACDNCTCRDCSHNSDGSCGRCIGQGMVPCIDNSSPTDTCFVEVRGEDLRYQ